MNQMKKAMEKPVESWSYNDFMAFLLMYAASADFQLADEEKEMLFSKVDLKDYRHVHRLFERQNDYQRLETIRSFRGRYYKNEADREKLLKELKDMFLADNRYDSVEKGFFMGLRRILV